MKQRALLASTMFTGLAFGLAFNAYAKDPELYFFPKNKWVIEKVSSSSAPTCTVSNQLNNGYIVQIAGTQNGFTNINLDLRQDVFDENMKYEVKYSIPGQKEALIPTKAFRKNMIVSDLRKEKSFGEALPSASVLDVAIRGNEFRMYLTGLEAVMDDYRGCLGIEVAKVEEPVAEPENMISAGGDLSAQDILKMEPKVMDESLAPPPPVHDPKPAIVSKVDNAADMPKEKLRPEKSSGIPRFIEQLAAKIKGGGEQYKAPEAVEIEVEAEAAPVPAAPVEKIAEQAPEPEAAAAPEVEEQSAKVEKKNGAIYNIVKPKEPIVADFTQVSEVEAEPVEAVAVEVASVSSEVMSEVAEKLNAIEPVSGTPDDHDTDFIMMRDKISELEERVHTLLSKNKMLDEELKATLKDAEEEKLSVSSNNWNLEVATMRFNEAERQIMRLGRQLNTQRSQCDAEKANLENMLFDPKLTDQQQLSKLASLESELEKSQSELYRQQRQYEERIKILEERLGAQ